MDRKSLLLSIVFQASILVPPVFGQSVDNLQASTDERLVRSLTALQAQIEQMNTELKEMREEEEKLRAETVELRKQLSSTSVPETPQISTRTEAYAVPARMENSNSDSDPDPPPPLDQRVDLLEKKVNEQYQTKLEAGSKYRVAFSGLVLLNLFANRGNVDSMENPATAEDIDMDTRARGSVGGTLRQTELGFQVNGPTVFGARASGNVLFDFAGGLTPTPGGETMGVVRLRTGTMRLDWASTSIVAGQDNLFFVPLAPTSYASLSQPALAYAGELWGWIPQVRVEQRLGAGFTVKAGVLDPIDFHFPDNSGDTRSPGAGEQTRMPGFGSHVGWSHSLFGRELSVGGGGYYGKQQPQAPVVQLTSSQLSTITSWLGSADWQIPLYRWFVLSGSLYRGSALAGLGGGLGQDVVFTLPDTTPPTELVRGLNSEGGWSQLKIQPLQKFEWNFAVGDDNPFVKQLGSGTTLAPSYLETHLARNRAAFGNMIYRPRSDLLFALEFRHIESFPTQDRSFSANHANLAMGIMF